jgi:hypothetical protein
MQLSSDISNQTAQSHRTNTHPEGTTQGPQIAHQSLQALKLHTTALKMHHNTTNALHGTAQSRGNITKHTSRSKSSNCTTTTPALSRGSSAHNLVAHQSLQVLELHRSQPHEKLLRLHQRKQLLQMLRGVHLSPPRQGRCENTSRTPVARTPTVGNTKTNTSPLVSLSTAPEDYSRSLTQSPASAERTHCPSTARSRVAAASCAPSTTAP